MEMPSLATSKKREEQADDPVNATKRRLFRGLNARIGVLGTTLLIGIGYLAIHWDEFSKVAIVAWAFDRLAELKPLPTASGQRFTIAIAILENDRDGVHRRVLRESLARLDGVELIMIDRRVSLDGTTRPQAAQLAGYARGREILRESHADVLIWGTAFDSAADSPMSLHWTSSANVRLGNRSHAYRPERDFDLPELFWKDLRDVLALLVTTGVAEFGQRQGSFVAEEMPPFLNRVRALLQADSPAIAHKAPLQIALADALMIYGAQRTDLALYEEAVGNYRQALQEYPYERMPLHWAGVRNQLGVALEALGDQAHDDSRLEEARATFIEVIGSNLRGLNPLVWGIVQGNLGNVLYDLGDHKHDTALLEDALAARRKALEGITQDVAPQAWAMLQYNLAVSLFTLGGMSHDKALLQECVAAAKRSLDGRSREREPLHWAESQGMIGNAFAALGALTKDASLLRESVAAFEQALREVTRERAPQLWARIESNLGSAQLTLYQATSNTRALEEAAVAYRSALTVYTREQSMGDWATAQHGLASALITFGLRTNSRARFQEGYSTYMEWLKAGAPAKTPGPVGLSCVNSTVVERIRLGAGQ
jgi:tetratricopeptide (TPR) repeat protein